MAATINPRDIQILGTTPRMVGVGLPSNIVVNPDNVDGLGLILNGIKRIWISATSQIFQIAKNDTVSPSSITLTANVRNLTATPTLTIVPGSGTMSVVPALTAGVFSFTEAQLTSNTITLRLSLTEDSVTYTDDFTFVKVREGDDSLNGYLTNESHTVPADYLGNVTSYAGASGTFNLLLGTLDVRTVSTFAVASGGNPDGLSVSITVSGSNAGNYIVTGGFPTNKDTVTVVFNATFGTTVFPKVLTLTKSKAGTNGAGSVTWTTRGGVVVNGSRAEKTSGTNDWNGEAASSQGFVGGAYVSFSAANTSGTIAVGLNTDPTSAPDYQSIDYSVYIQGDGKLYTIESGSVVSHGSYVAGDSFVVKYSEIGTSSAKVTYYKNGVSFRELSVPRNLLLYADSCFYHVGSSVNNLVFGPVGSSGENGTPGIRGSKQFYVGLSGSVGAWSDVLAVNAASVDGGPVLNDQVTQYNNSVGFSQTKFWNGSTWVTVDAVVDGNLLVTGTIGASKVVVNAGVGANVWFDPNYADSSAWQVASWGVLPLRVTLTDGITSGTAMRSPSAVPASARGSFRTPVVVGKKYRISVKVRKSSTANGLFYVRLDVGSSRSGAYSDTILGIEEVSSVTTSWQEYSAVWTATAPWASVMVLLNHYGTSGYMEAQDIRIEEMNAAGLIVQGGIIADQIDSRGLSIKDASGNIILAAGNSLPIGYVPQGTINNLINLDFWRKGGTISWPTNYEQNDLLTCSPTVGDPVNILAAGPKGGNDVVWYCKEITGDSNPGGGWHAAPFTVPLDPTKAYRFVLPIRRISGTGTSYWGVSNVCDLNTTTLNGNPYFAYTVNMPTDRWYLFVGYVYPYGSTGNVHESAGIWDCKTGLKVRAGFNWNHSAAGVSSHRAYQYYASSGAEQMFGRPCVNIVDGTEPSLRDYFEPGAVLNDALVPSITAAATTATWTGVSGSGKPQDNATVGATFGVNIGGQITSGNASTYIANAAIGTAQISELNASKIVAGSITADKIQAGTITADRIQVGAVTAATSLSIDNEVFTWPNSATVFSPYSRSDEGLFGVTHTYAGGVLKVNVDIRFYIQSSNTLLESFQIDVELLRKSAINSPIFVTERFVPEVRRAVRLGSSSVYSATTTISRQFNVGQLTTGEIYYFGVYVTNLIGSNGEGNIVAPGSGTYVYCFGEVSAMENKV